MPNECEMADISIIALPPSRWQEARALRLEALQQEPTAFAGSYEEEQAFADEVWINRVTSAFARDGNLALYAEIEGKLAGIVGAVWSNRRKQRHVAEVYSFYVSPPARGQGLGMKLMTALLEELEARPLIEKVRLMVTSSHEAAIGLYQRMGFEIVGRAARELKVNGCDYDLYYMERRLASD